MSAHFSQAKLTVHHPLHYARLQEHTLGWALVVSFLLHALFMYVMPGIDFDPIAKKTDLLSVELVQPKPVEPAAIPEQPQPTPAPAPIKQTPTPKPVVKKIEAPSPIKQEPSPTQPAPTMEALSKVIAAEPKAESKPETVVTSLPLEKTKPEPNHADIENALGEYTGLLGRAIAKHKQYPRIAQMRGWQGDVLLDLKIDASGNVISAKVRESSGHDALDNQAIEMVKKASPFPQPPAVLRNGNFNITVPVSFKLESA